MNNREAAKRVEAYIIETRKMIGNDPEVLNMANGHKLLASDLLLLAGLASQAQQPTAYRVIASANGEVVRDSLEFTRMSEIDEKVVRKSYDLEIVPLYAAMQSQQDHIGDGNELAKHQPCGCVICTCEHETQCQGCGAKHCGAHDVGDIPNPVYLQSQAQQEPEKCKQCGVRVDNGHCLGDIWNCSAMQSQAQQPTKSPPEWEKNVSRMWQCVRKHDCDIPSDDLDLMRQILLQSQAQQSQWISVDERLPETDDYVFVYLPNNNYLKVDVDCWQMQKESPLSFSSQTVDIGMGWDDNDFEDVSHWMPLPPAPEGGDK